VLLQKGDAFVRWWWQRWTSASWYVFFEELLLGGLVGIEQPFTTLSFGEQSQAWQASFSDSSDYFGVQIFGEQGFVVA
jgi:hypothetical protein